MFYDATGAASFFPNLPLTSFLTYCCTSIRISTYTVYRKYVFSIDKKEEKNKIKNPLVFSIHRQKTMNRQFRRGFSHHWIFYSWRRGGARSSCKDFTILREKGCRIYR